MKFISCLCISILGSVYIMAQPIIINNVRTNAHVPLPSKKLSLVPPPSYIPLPDDAGFFLQGTTPENGDEQIKVSKFLIDFTIIKQNLQSSAPGVDVVINNYSGIWIKSKENIEGRVFTSLTLGFGNNAYSYVIVGVFPSENTTIETKLQKAVQSAYVDTFGYSIAPARINNIQKRFTEAKKAFETKLVSRFKIDLSGTPFKPAEIVSSDHIIYTLDGAYPPFATDKSQMEIKYTSATVSENSYLSYSTQFLNTNSGFNTVTGISSTTIEINGLKGIEITANAIYASPSAPIKVYQLTLFEEHGVYSITGISHQNTTDMIDMFKKAAKTFTRIP